VTIDDLGDPSDGITRIALRFGYTGSPQAPDAPPTLTNDQAEGRLDLEDAIYFLSKV
jgi:KUP system potassium uptake protein